MLINVLLYLENIFKFVPISTKLTYLLTNYFL